MYTIHKYIYTQIHFYIKIWTQKKQVGININKYFKS